MVIISAAIVPRAGTGLRGWDVFCRRCSASNRNQTVQYGNDGSSLSDGLGFGMRVVKDAFCDDLKHCVGVRVPGEISCCRSEPHGGDFSGLVPLSLGHGGARPAQ